MHSTECTLSSFIPHRATRILVIANSRGKNFTTRERERRQRATQIIDWNAHEKINDGNLITGYLITARRGEKKNKYRSSAAPLFKDKI